MATSAQLKSLFKSYIENDSTRFYSTAMQIAAHEARIGHNEVAKELRDLIDQAKEKKQTNSLVDTKTVPIVRPTGDLANLVSVSYPDTKFSEMILRDTVSKRLERIIKEQRKREKIQSYGLSPRRKFLLVGPPGTGKTMTAFALAGELRLPLFLIRFESMITKYMGETSSKLRIIFDAIKEHRGVYLFDEFDTIGSMRGMSNDVGETRRILNSFLQFIDKDDSNSIIFAATNHPDILDYALFRRFDDVLEYDLPLEKESISILKNRLFQFIDKEFDWSDCIKYTEGLSHAELTRAADDAIKNAIMIDEDKISSSDIISSLKERRKYHDKTFSKYTSK